MLIYKINFSLLTLFSLLIYTFCGRGLKGRAGCRQTEVQTKNRQGAGRTKSGAYYVTVLTPDAASRPAALIARPTASLPL